MSSSTVNPAEVEKFSKIADEWWDENGKFKPLHKFNPIRIGFIKEKLISHFRLDPNSKTPLNSLNIADIGCGGGLLTEPMAKAGAKMVGIDASNKNIEVAKIHAQKSNLAIDYRNSTIEELAKNNQKFDKGFAKEFAKEFDVILAMEVIEHVDNVENFIAGLSACLKEGGILFIATLNRTPASYLKAILGAEYLLRWLPIGTHSWQKFLKPSEIHQMAKNNALELVEAKGFDYNLLSDSWKLTNNLDVNYVMVFKKS